VENLFNKQSAKFIQNRPSFMKVMVKQILVCFFMPHSVYKLHNNMSQSIAVLWVNASPATREIHSGEISELLIELWQMA